MQTSGTQDGKRRIEMHKNAPTHPYCLVIIRMAEFLFLFSMFVDSCPHTAIESMFQDFIISFFTYSINKAFS